MWFCHSNFLLKCVCFTVTVLFENENVRLCQIETYENFAGLSFLPNVTKFIIPSWLSGRWLLRKKYLWRLYLNKSSCRPSVSEVAAMQVDLDTREHAESWKCWHEKKFLHLCLFFWLCWVLIFRQLVFLFFCHFFVLLGMHGAVIVVFKFKIRSFFLQNIHSQGKYGGGSDVSAESTNEKRRWLQPGPHPRCRCLVWNIWTLCENKQCFQSHNGCG